ncbi:hypothetical protein FRAHR75_570020 [Frankia sp. Hr75.2]|nr:hypothetical protein FRAHR75_570020 [Frankia sp. Hr75.2]
MHVSHECVTYPASETTLAVLSPAADALRQIAKQESADEDGIEAIIAALVDRQVAKAPASALTHVDSARGRAHARSARPTQHRRPIGAPPAVQPALPTPAGGKVNHRPHPLD